MSNFIAAPVTYHRNQDDVGNQSDSSGTSNSSLASSSRYNERHPRVLESVRKKSSGRIYSGAGNVTANSRGSVVMLGSRTSLPPLDENSMLDATESQLALNLRRATRSSSWTNQKILNAIDGLNTGPGTTSELGKFLGGVVANLSSTSADEAASKNDSCRKSSFEKFVLAKSISNLIMKSRSSGSVNPVTSGQNKQDSSCYNFLSEIREDEDEEQQDDNCNAGGSSGPAGKHPSNPTATAGNRIKAATPTTQLANAAVALAASDEISRKHTGANRGETDDAQHGNDHGNPSGPTDDKSGAHQLLERSSHGSNSASKYPHA